MCICMCTCVCICVSSGRGAQLCKQGRAGVKGWRGESGTQGFLRGLGYWTAGICRCRRVSLEEDSKREICKFVLETMRSFEQEGVGGPCVHHKMTAHHGGCSGDMLGVLARD